MRRLERRTVSGQKPGAVLREVCGMAAPRPCTREAGLLLCGHVNHGRWLALAREIVAAGNGVSSSTPQLRPLPS